MAGNDLGPYWSLTGAELLQKLGSRQEGLTSEEAEARLDEYGPNTIREERKASAIGLFLGQFRSPMMLILIGATIVSALVGQFTDAIVIIAIVIGSATLSFLQEFRASSATAKLRAQVTIRADVLRDGKVVEVPASELVPGDIVQLSAGALVPADGVMLEAHDLYVSQAVLTGETFPVEKTTEPVAADAALTARTNCVFLGTNVRSGTGRALIVITGLHTSFGEIAQRLNLRPPETEFERGIRRFGYLLTQVMMVLVVIVFGANVYFQKPVLDSLLFSVALAVGLTPELLPAIVSITLAKGSQEMAAHGVIVRRLESLENLSSMDTLCSDKTGTLTAGVVRLDGALDVDGQPSPAVLRWAYLNAHLQTGLANPLDTAITAQEAPDIAAVVKIDEVPYDFHRKRLSIVVQDGDRRTMITKGALDFVLQVCDHVRLGDTSRPLDQDYLDEIKARLQDWSQQGFRVLGLAVRDMPEQAAYTRQDEEQMEFAGFLIFFDPPKPEVKQTITDLAGLGVQLKIISGDNQLVALHVAQQVGLDVTGVVTGEDISGLSDEALWQRAAASNLFVDVDPNQKERIILALKKTRHVVGYLGDGVNDAPALHAADVGISVDTAVDVAREAADLVLLSRDLDVLRQGITEGRRAFANTLKYVFVTTSANFGNMFSMAGASLFLPFLPMLPLQILLTNFITDFPAMAIAGDSVDAELSQRPRRWDMRFIRDFMVVFGIISSLFDYVTFGLLLLIIHASPVEFRTSWFLESVVTELLILLVIRTRRPVYRSRPSRTLLIASLVIAVLTVLLPYLPFHAVLGLTPLSARLLLALAGITLVYIVMSELAKRWFYKRHD